MSGMDDQSFQLLMSKLEDLSAGQARIEGQINDRLDKHYELFRQHVEDDKTQSEKLSLHLNAVEKEITFAKGVTYTLNGLAAATYAFFGWGK